jgi:hypothetical protein
LSDQRRRVCLSPHSVRTAQARVIAPALGESANELRNAIAKHQSERFCASFAVDEKKTMADYLSRVHGAIRDRKHIRNDGVVTD